MQFQSSFMRTVAGAVFLLGLFFSAADAFVTPSLRLPVAGSSRSTNKGPVLPLMMSGRRGGGRRGGGGRSFYGGGLGHEASTAKRAGRVGKMVMTELMQILRSPYLIKTPKDKMNVDLVALVSIVEVEMSKDTKVAKVMVSAQGTDTQKRQAVRWLNENTKALRFALAQRMKHLKSVPELRFTEARLPQAMSVMSILDQIAKEREEKEAKERALSGEEALAGAKDVCDGMEREMARLSERQDMHSSATSPLSVSM